MKYSKKSLGPIIALTITGGLFAQQALAAPAATAVLNGTKTEVNDVGMDHILTKSSTLNSKNTANANVTSNLTRSLNYDGASAPTGVDKANLTSQKGAETLSSKTINRRNDLSLVSLGQNVNITGGASTNMDDSNFAMDIGKSNSQSNYTNLEKGEWKINATSSSTDTKSRTNMFSKGADSYSLDQTFIANQVSVKSKNTGKLAYNGHLKETISTTGYSSVTAGGYDQGVNVKGVDQIYIATQNAGARTQ